MVFSAFLKFLPIFTQKFYLVSLYYFAILYSGQDKTCSQNKYGSSTSSCDREAETTKSGADCCVRHSNALCCHHTVRFTLALFYDQFSTI